MLESITKLEYARLSKDVPSSCATKVVRLSSEIRAKHLIKSEEVTLLPMSHTADDDMVAFSVEMYNGKTTCFKCSRSFVDNNQQSEDSPFDEIIEEIYILVRGGVIVSDYRDTLNYQMTNGQISPVWNKIKLSVDVLDEMAYPQFAFNRRKLSEQVSYLHYMEPRYHDSDDLFGPTARLIEAYVKIKTEKCRLIHPLSEKLTEVYKTLFGDDVELSMSSRLPIQSGIAIKSKPTVGLYDQETVDAAFKAIDDLVPGGDHASVDLHDFLISQLKYAVSFVKYVSELTAQENDRDEVSNVIKDIVSYWLETGIDEKVHNLPRVIGIIEGLYKERVEPRQTRHFYHSRILPCCLSESTSELITSTYERIIGDPIVKL